MVTWVKYGWNESQYLVALITHWVSLAVSKQLKVAPKEFSFSFKFINWEEFKFVVELSSQFSCKSAIGKRISFSSQCEGELSCNTRNKRQILF